MPAYNYFMAKHALCNTRQVIQWGEVVSRLGDCVLVPISPAIFHVAANLLSSRGLWSATFALDTPGQMGYESPDRTSEDWQRYEHELSSFLSDGLEFMTRFDELIKSQLRIEFALTGLPLDLDNTDAYFTGDMDVLGIGPSITNNNPNTNLENIKGAIDATNTGLGNIKDALDDAVTQLDNIRAAIAAQSTGDPEQLADDLEGIVNTIQTVATVLGALA